MTKFYVVRHGLSEWNRDHDRYCGSTDIPLSAEGKSQAKLAAQYLGQLPIDQIYCSDLVRAVETAGLAAEELGCAVQVDERIREMDFGVCEGLTKHQIAEQFPQEWTAWLADAVDFPAGVTGETARQVYERNKSFYMDKAEAFPEQTILVISHSTSMRIWMAGSLEMPLKNYRRIFQHNTGISVFDMAESEVKWMKMNDTAHLQKHFA